MDDFLEYEKETKSLKSIDLDDFSIEDLKKYLEQLQNEIERANSEIDKKMNTQIAAAKYFK